MSLWWESLDDVARSLTAKADVTEVTEVSAISRRRPMLVSRVQGHRVVIDSLRTRREGNERWTSRICSRHLTRVTRQQGCYLSILASLAVLQERDRATTKIGFWTRKSFFFNARSSEWTPRGLRCLWNLSEMYISITQHSCSIRECESPRHSCGARGRQQLSAWRH